MTTSVHIFSLISMMVLPEDVVSVGSSIVLMLALRRLLL
jgi:hypothetical protein